MATQLSSTLTLTLSGDHEIIATRLFDAPKELVFKAHSSCEHLSRWMGPRSLTMSSCEMDFRPGGAYRFAHRDANGTEYKFRGEFQEVVPPERIVRTFEFESIPGHIAVETLILEEYEGKTKLTVKSLWSTKEDRDGMAQSGMEEGMRDSWDRLEEYLQTMA